MNRPSLGSLEFELLLRKVRQDLRARRGNVATVEGDRGPRRERHLAARLDEAGSQRQDVAVLAARLKSFEMAALKLAVTWHSPVDDAAVDARLYSQRRRTSFRASVVTESAAMWGSCIDTIRRSSQRVTRPSPSRKRKKRVSTLQRRSSSCR